MSFHPDCLIAASMTGNDGQVARRYALTGARKRCLPMRKARDWPVVEATQEIHSPDQNPYSAPLITCMILIMGRGRGDGGLGEG